MAKLLVSDDDPQVLDLVTLVLEGAGHTVVATGDAGAVQSLARRPGFDAIILDVNMPKSGFEILGELRHDPSTSALPILFLSGLVDREYRARGLVEGADDYMVKPFEPAELVLRVERLIQRAGRFGRYQKIDVIGQGSMGTVYRGLDPRLERPVALKTIRLESTTTGDRRRELLERLRNEAVTIARLSHPTSSRSTTWATSSVRRSSPWSWSRVCRLRDLLRRVGPLPADRLIPLAAAVASGLALAHERGVIHGDVKPGNVLLGRDGADQGERLRPLFRGFCHQGRRGRGDTGVRAPGGDELEALLREGRHLRPGGDDVPESDRHPSADRRKLARDDREHVARRGPAAA